MTEKQGGEMNFKFLSYTGAINVVLGAAMIGVASPLLQGMTTYNAIATALVEGGADGAEVLGGYMQLLVPLVLGGAGACIAGGIVGCLAGSTSNKYLGILYALLVLGGAVCQVIGALNFSTVLESFESTLVPIPNRSPEFNAEQYAVLNLPHAVYSVCCEAVYNTDKIMQAPANECAGTEDSDYSPLPDLIPKEFIAIAPKLLTCYKPQANFDKMAEALKSQETCKALEYVSISIPENIEIPEQDVNLNTVIPKVVEFAAYAPILYLTIVGDPKPREFDGAEFSLTDGPAADSPDPGWGCGLGFVKGVHWTINLFLSSVGQNVVYAGYALGGFNVLVVILGWFYMFLVAGDDESYIFEDKTGVVGGNVSNVQGYYNKGPDDAASRKKLGSQLMDFYKTHDPSRAEPGRVEELLDYTMKHGRAALNGKLKSKYGVDLDDEPDIDGAL